MGQTSNIKDEEINGDNIPLNKLYKCRHIATKKKKTKTKRQYFTTKLFITSHNKDQ